MLTNAFKRSCPLKIACLISLLSITGTKNDVWAKVPLKPFTASELPVMATTPNLIYGNYGPQANLNLSPIPNLPEAIYIKKSLSFVLESSPILVDEIAIKYANTIHKEDRLLSKSIQLSSADIQELAQKETLACQDQDFFCDVSVRMNGVNQLLIEVTPLKLKSFDIEVADRREEQALKYLLHTIELNGLFSISKLQQQLRLIQSNPDLKFSTSLEVLPEEHQVNIKIENHKPGKHLHLIGSVNNLDQIIFGSKFAALTAVTNNATGHGDSLMTGVVQGYRSTGGFSRYEYPLRPNLKATLEGQYASISPFQIDYDRFDEHGYAYRISPGIKYTILDRPNLRISSDLQFDFKQAKSHWAGGELEREYVRTLKAGVNYDQNIGKTTISSRHELAGAAAVLGGSSSNDKRLSWYKGGSQYWRYTGYASLLRQLPLNSTGTLNFQWQYTPNGLSNFDVGGLGGTFYGRGYREVYLFVDRYAILTTQWQVPAYFIPKNIKLPYASKPLRETTQVLTFMDYGQGSIAAPPDDIQKSYRIFSTGLGVRSQLTDRLTGRIDIGYPIIREAPWGQRPRLHFGMDVAIK